jgi:hypothetical protein
MGASKLANYSQETIQYQRSQELLVILQESKSLRISNTIQQLPGSN